MTKPNFAVTREPSPVRPVRIDRVEADPLSALIARLMDTLFVIPGTNIRFGFDAIVGLFPGIGDSIGAVISSFIIAQGVRMGVPKIVLARMAVNVFINTVVGTVPIFGDIFSIYFRSNVKNYGLLQRHANQDHASTAKDWIFVSVLLLALLSLLAGAIYGIILLLQNAGQVPRSPQ